VIENLDIVCGGAHQPRGCLSARDKVIGDCGHALGPCVHRGNQFSRHGVGTKRRLTAFFKKGSHDLRVFS
jgi:hypothetical protein